MMRCFLLINLLFSTILICEAQGLCKGSILDRKHGSIHEISPEIEEVIIFREKQRSGKKIRKLIMNTMSSPTKTAKNYKKEENKVHPNSDDSSTIGKKGRKEENVFVKSSSVTEQLQANQENLDIVEMDYTIARRKPPIHN